MSLRAFAAMKSARRVLVVSLALVGLLCCAAPADRAITKVDVFDWVDRVAIRVQADSELVMTPIRSAMGRYAAFQFPFKLATKGRLVGIHSGGIHNIRYGNFQSKPATTRIVANTRNYVSYSTVWSADRRTVEISVWKQGYKQAKSKISGIAALPFATADPIQKVLPFVEERTAPEATPEAQKPNDQPANDEVVAVPPPAASPKPRVVAKAPTASEPKSVVSGSTSGKSISLNFLGADINDVLKALSIQSGKNIVSSKDVTGTVTLSLQNVGVEEALDYVAKLSGYSYAKLNDTYIVGQRDAVKNLTSGSSEETKVEVVAISNAAVEDVMEFLKTEYPGVKVTRGGGGKTGGTPGGFLMLSGPEDMVEKARLFVGKIDESMKQLVGEATTELYEVKYVDGSELAATLTASVPRVNVSYAPAEGFDLQGPSAITVMAETGSTVQQAAQAPKKEVRPRSLLISGPSTAVKQAVELAQRLDVKAPQIKIEAKITSLTESGEKKLGLMWEWDEVVRNGDSASKMLLGPRNYLSTLEALVKSGDGELLASPTLLCLEGKPGVFFVGDEVRYVVLVQVTPTGTNVTTETANVGVQLRVVGDVSPDGYITLNLHPEVSVIKLVYDKQANINLPTITRRFTDHVVRVKSGETLVIGGLIRNEELDELSKVPVLGDLPFFGHLFRHSAKIKERSEVVMFLKADIIYK